MKYLLTILLIATSFTSIAQEHKSTDSILSTYLNELKLDESQSEQFTTIYNKYKTELDSETIENNSFNRLNKNRDLEFYAILTKEQNALYKKLKKEFESNLKYRM